MRHCLATDAFELWWALQAKVNAFTHRKLEGIIGCANTLAPSSAQVNLSRMKELAALLQFIITSYSVAMHTRTKRGFSFEMFGYSIMCSAYTWAQNRRWVFSLMRNCRANVSGGCQDRPKYWAGRRKQPDRLIFFDARQRKSERIKSNWKAIP